jgi:hypothetical protein
MLLWMHGACELSKSLHNVHNHRASNFSITDNDTQVYIVSRYINQLSSEKEIAVLLQSGQKERIVYTLGDHFGGAPLNNYEHLVYAAPIPTPAPRATDAQRVVGLPVQNSKTQHVNRCNPIVYVSSM